MNKYSKEFNNNLNKLFEEVLSKEEDNIKKAAKIMFDTMKNKGIVHVFATGHSHMFCEELFYRAGGLVQIDPVLNPYLMQHEGAVSSTKYERLEGIAKIIYEGIDLNENEAFIIVSNSGINAVPIEMAKIVKENNHPLIVLTSKEASSKLKSRCKDGSHLYEYGDVVIDNHVPYGDGLVENKYGRIGSASSIVSNYIAQRLVLEIISLYEENNMEPNIYFSANTEGGDKHNIEALKEYQKRIRRLY